MLNSEKTGLAWIDDLTGGVNDRDAPQKIGPTHCQIAQNVEWHTTRFAQRRQGGTNGIHATEPWGASNSLIAVLRHTPTADEAAAELWGVDVQATPATGRMAGSNQFVAVTVNDAWTAADTKYINGCSLNGKLFVAGNTAVDRLHVWDGSAFRRVGIATPAAATVANTGAGAYAATLRYYRIQFRNTTPEPDIYSELGPAVAFTPSGAGTHARVTRPALVNENETEWLLWGSPDGTNYYLITTVASATTTYDDNADPATYATLVPIFAGFPTDPDYFTVPMSPKYLLADEDRLILLSSWETASAASAVMWTPVNGTTPANFRAADDERVPSTNRLDVDRQHGGGITGGAIWNGSLWIFKLSQIHEYVRTGDDDQPYRPAWKTTGVGCVSHKSIVIAEDENGASALYFLSKRGPYRLSQAGLEFLGRDITTTWGTVTKSAVTPPFGVWHEDKRQVWWWVTTPGAPSNATNKKLVFHVDHGRRTENGIVRGGWATHTGGGAEGYAAVMFANTLGATMSTDLKPYFAQQWVSGMPDGPLFKYDSDGTYTDSGAALQTYIARVKTGAFPPNAEGSKGGVTQMYVLGTPANRTLAVDVVRDFGLDTRSGTAVLPAASGSETRVEVKVEDDAAAADAKYVEIIIDDEGHGNAAWTVDAVGVRRRREAQT